MMYNQVLVYIAYNGVFCLVHALKSHGIIHHKTYFAPAQQRAACRCNLFLVVVVRGTGFQNPLFSLVDFVLIDSPTLPGVQSHSQFIHQITAL